MNGFKMGAFAGLILLAGCKASVQTEVNLSALSPDKASLMQGDLYVEVPACNSMEDSRKPSSSVEDAKKNVPSIFKDAQYVECFRKQFDSLAHFEIPIAVAKDNKEKSAVENIAIISRRNGLIAVTIPREIKQNIERVQRNTFGASNIDLAVNLKLTNDTKKRMQAQVWSAFVNRKPVVHGKMEMDPGESISIKLSDVSVAKALESGSAVVLSR